MAAATLPPVLGPLLTSTLLLAATLAPAEAAASGCKRGSAEYERAQFGMDLGLSVGGVAAAATGRYGVLQVQRAQWVPAIDRRVPIDGAKGGELASEVLLYTSYAAAVGWGVYETIRCRHETTLSRSRATPLLQVVWPWLWTFGLTELTKSFAGRPRPYTRGDTGFTGEDDDYRAFPSGHTSTSAAMATITIASALRFVPRLSRPLPRIAIAASVGAAYGLTTGGMRVLAANHHVSDILVGAALGTGIGLLPIATERFGRERRGAAEVSISPWIGATGGSVRARF